MGRAHHIPSHELTDGSKRAIYAHLLGPVRIYVNDCPLQDSAWQRRSSRSLLFLLLATPGHALPRDRILDELWPGAAPAAAVNALYVTIHGLRRALEPDLRSGRESSFVEVVGDIVRLRPDCPLWVDVDAFEKTLARAAGEPPRERLITLRQALALYADDLLVDEPYADWPVLRREQLRSAWRSALFEVADLEIESGNPLAATKLLPQVLNRDPADEAAHYRLMRALASAGQINEALLQYERCVALLHEEVGSQPSAETSRLAAEIRSMAPDHPLLEATKDSGRHFANVPAAPNPLVGRSREMGTIEDLLLDPQIRLVTLTGPAGIGKTRLALELATRMVEEFANGVVFVPLASLTDPDLVAPTLLRLLDPGADPAAPSLESLY